ncbi:MAG TPA: dihydrodipicolinate synthase family protein [Blastocatellia bacterium]|jgi:dihydrodipicolinate synthase/N-acetylneuraminate lyase|nr:dihydrodipicolinate synthase family protein [Blastocatellia bacterium]
MEPSINVSDARRWLPGSRAEIPGPRYEPRRGLSIPSVTVIDSYGRVVEEEQRRVFQFIAQQGLGADIIFGVGTTGEWNRITNAERQRLIRIEADEVFRINEQVTPRGLRPIEAWVGVTAETRAETLANLECAIEAGADAAVIAPLSIKDAGDIVTFFQREVSDLFDHKGRWVPVFLYDNADIAADPRTPHIRTRDVKRLSRLPFVFGVKVSAPRRVLGNYTKGAGHFKDKGEFGIYVGNAMLMFQVFKLEDGFIGRVREYWNRYLLHNELPVGVVAGPANAMPREWQRAWRACYAGDERLMPIYKSAFEEFSAACRFANNGKTVKKTIACLKQALKLDGVIASDNVAEGTRALTEEERRLFAARYQRIKDDLAAGVDPLWISKKA